MLSAIREVRAEGRNVTVTMLMRKSNMSYTRLNKLLSQLVGSGLLEKKGGQYNLSTRGLEFLSLYSEFDQFAESFGLRI